MDLQMQDREYHIEEEEEVGLLRRLPEARRNDIEDNGEQEPEPQEEEEEEVQANGEQMLETEAEKGPPEKAENEPEDVEVEHENNSSEDNYRGDVDVGAVDLVAERRTEEDSAKALQESLLDLDDERVTKFTEKFLETEHSDVKQFHETETAFQSLDATPEISSVEKLLSAHIYSQHDGNSGDNEFSHSDMLSSVKSYEEIRTYSNKSEVVEEVDLIEELNPEETEFDVEKVIKEQNTHDLFCPNCKSCITKIVILRRRKRRVRNVRYRAKYGQAEKVIAPPSNAEEATVPTGSQVATTTDTDDVPTRDQELLGCLSCFSIFINTANGLRRLFGGRKDDNEVQDSQKVTVGPTATEPGDAVTETPQMEIEHTDLAAVNNQLSNMNDSVSPTKDTSLPMETLPIMGVLDDKFDRKDTDGSVPEVVASNFNNEAPTSTEQDDYGECLVANGQSQEDVFSKAQPVGVKMPLTIGTMAVGQTLIKIDQKPVEKTVEELPDVDGQSAVAVTVKKSSNEVVVVIGREPVDGAPSPTTETQTDTKIAVAPVEMPPESGTALVVEEQTVAEVHQAREWDILKSIVYGGLVESITSLGVVSSAAGAGAATLNTLGLGLANLIGGIFVIAHNLRELKNEQPSQSAGQADRYEELLGKRGHFTLHATLVILSYIIFGSVAPITYGFAFRVSNNTDLKLAALGAASLSCILLLAIGKAYVKKPPKSYFRTISYYLILGVMASGASFIIGELIDKLLTKLGLFDSTSSVSETALSLNTMPVQSGWASY